MIVSIAVVLVVLKLKKIDIIEVDTNRVYGDYYFSDDDERAGERIDQLRMEAVDHNTNYERS